MSFLDLSIEAYLQQYKGPSTHSHRNRKQPGNQFGRSGHNKLPSSTFRSEVTKNYQSSRIKDLDQDYNLLHPDAGAIGRLISACTGQRCIDQLVTLSAEEEQEMRWYIGCRSAILRDCRDISEISLE